MEALRKEIQLKCRKRSEFVTAHDDIENDEYQEGDMEKEDDISKMKVDEIVEELPFEQILAEQRRKYTAREEFIYLLYNDILPIFVTEWNGYFLRKESVKKKSCRDNIEIIEEDEEIDDHDESNDSAVKEKSEENVQRVLPWKLSLPDEYADIIFYNNNSYHGRISRKMMEGEGLYQWHNGVQYKGQFEQNQIQGRGILKWNDDCSYEGDFMNGLRHGRGTIVDKMHNCMYIGYWHMGHKRKE